MKKILNLLLLSILIFSCKTQESTRTVNELNSKIDHIFRESNIPGFSVIVVNDKDVLYQNAFGFADIDSGKAFTNNTIKNIASVSKTFLGVAVMKAVEQGKVDLDTDINTYLPFQVRNPKYPKRPITLRQLATHTSSIDDDETYSKSYVLMEDGYNFSSLPKDIEAYITPMKINRKMDDSEFLRNVLSKDGKWYSKKSFIKKEPGEKYNYSNIGASLAAFTIENAVGVSYEDYSREFILKPLEMTQTGWEEKDVDMNNYATGYFTKDIPVPSYYLITKADGALITNTTDFGKYLMEILKGCKGEGTLLSPKLYNEMFTRKEFGNESNGIFWGVSESGNPNHSGSDPGVITITSVNPKTNLAVFFMANIDIDISKSEMKSIMKVLHTLKIHNWK